MSKSRAEWVPCSSQGREEDMIFIQGGKLVAFLSAAQVQAAPDRRERPWSVSNDCITSQKGSTIPAAPAVSR